MASTENEYRKYLSLVQQNRLLFTILAVAICTAGVAVAYLMPVKYEARSTVFIEKSVLSDLVKGLAVTQEIEGRLKVLSHMLASRHLLQKVIDELDVDLVGDKKDVNALIRNFQQNTTVTIKGKEDLFTIQYTDANPRLARDYVNTLIQKYIEEHLATSRQESYGANRFMMEQMEHFRTLIQEAEDRLAAFTQKENYAVMGEDTLVLEMRAQEKELDELEIQRHALLAKRNLLNRGSEQGGTSGENLAALQRRRDQLLLSYTENYPEVKLINAEIQQIQAAMKNAPRSKVRSEPTASTLEGSMVGIELATLDSRADKVRRSIEEKRALLVSLPEKRKVYTALLRDRDTYKNTYDQLVQRFGKSELSKQMEIQDKVDTFRIVDPAVLPDKPANRNRVMLLLFALAAGVAASFGFLLGRDYLDSNIKSITSVQNIGLPVLALIPQFITAEERLRWKKQGVALVAFVGIYLLGYLLLLTWEVLQMLDVSLIAGLPPGLRSGGPVTAALNDLVGNLI